MAKVSKSRQAGRRLGESLRATVETMSNTETRKEVISGIMEALSGGFMCTTCFKKHYCASYNNKTISCSQYGDERKVL
ncbi:MAG: hypothetical protein KAS32_03245 [Candidatus Peribacteraceae bacterium]|nr:hypothetical protein [Candidatus Peribacteraceae bacterium]